MQKKNNIPQLTKARQIHSENSRNRERIERRFWAKVKIDPNGCWLWQGSTKGDGNNYGQFGFCGKVSAAHRVSYELHYGPFDKALHVLHRCDCPPCVRPDHLFLGTHLDNMLDKLNKDRVPHGENAGRAKLTAVQVHEVLEDYASGLNIREVAEKFGVSKCAIGAILRGVSWREITNGARVTRRNEGEASPTAKLKEAQVLEIRSKHATGEFTFKQLGRMFSVSEATISMLVNRKTWRHI